jgi:hypothetical protein
MGQILIISYFTFDPLAHILVNCNPIFIILEKFLACLVGIVTIEPKRQVIAITLVKEYPAGYSTNNAFYLEIIAFSQKNSETIFHV